MAYYQLDINPHSPEKVRRFIRQHVDMLFHDVHCMMRLPIAAQELYAGCNFAAATFLLDLISGISTALHSASGGSGAHFKDVLKNYYPWEMEPQGSVDAQAGATTLYNIFRNPLIHALGIGKNRVAIAKSGLPEDLLESLERSVTRPKDGPAAATMRVYPAEDRTDLHVDGLYWGVRFMVRRLTDDHTLMTSVAQKLP